MTLTSGLDGLGSESYPGREDIQWFILGDYSQGNNPVGMRHSEKGQPSAVYPHPVSRSPLQPVC